MTTTKYNPRQEYTARPKKLAGDIRRAEKKLEKAQRLFKMVPVNSNSLEDQLEQAKIMKRRAARLERVLEELMTLHAYRDGLATPKEERLAASDRYEAICKMEAERERREGR
jgi:hypothetical protein